MHKCAQLTQTLSSARYYESETQIQNGVNTSTVILLKTKCLVRFSNFFFWGGGGGVLLNFRAVENRVETGL